MKNSKPVEIIQQLTSEEISDIITSWKTILLSCIESDSSKFELDTSESYCIISGLNSSSISGDSFETLFGRNISLRETIQILAQGKVSIVTDKTVIHCDIKNLYLHTTDRSDSLEDITGKWKSVVSEILDRSSQTATVCIVPYEDISMSERSRILKKDIRYIWDMDMDILINNLRVKGETCDRSMTNRFHINNTPVFSYLNLSESDAISVYSHGIYITEFYDSHFSGTIIIKGKVDQQTYKNIDSEPFFSNVLSKLEKEKLRYFGGLSYTDYTTKIRGFMAKKLFEDTTQLENVWDSKYLFSSPSDSLYSFNQISSASSVGFSDYGNDTADELEERGHIILNKQDPAVQHLQKNSTEYNCVNIETLSERYNKTDDTVLNVSDLTERQRIKLGVARYISIKLDIDRKIVYGSSTNKNAWTNGNSYIVITDSATPSEKWIQWVPELFRILIHEYSHTKNIMDSSPNHGNAFAQNYRKNIDLKWSKLSELIDKIDSDGIHTFDIAHTQKI